MIREIEKEDYEQVYEQGMSKWESGEDAHINFNPSFNENN